MFQIGELSNRRACQAKPFGFTKILAYYRLRNALQMAGGVTMMKTLNGCASFGEYTLWT